MNEYEWFIWKGMIVKVWWNYKLISFIEDEGKLGFNLVSLMK